MKRFLFLGCLALFAASLTQAQDVRASISGVVTDPTGAAVAEVPIRVTSVERGTVTEAITNETGRYLVQFLLPGTYTLTAEKAGFKKFVHSDIALTAADHPAVDIVLELGSAAEAVTVSGDVSLLQTETSSRVANIESRAVEDIPTAGRNLYQFQYTLPGVIKNSRYWGSMELYAFSNINNVSIGGGRNGENETLIDGVSNTRMDRGVVYAPSLNGTREVSVQTNIYDAQYGRVGGGVTLITTRSGTNSLHGQLFEFFKNDKLNAADWIANKYGEGRTPMRNNTYGFEVDGPVYLPKLFDGRNRAFFMLSLEGLREHNTSSVQENVPTALERTGDFSKSVNADGKSIELYDPTTTRVGPAGTPIRTPFPNAIIPASRISPIAKNLLSYLPAPTSNGDNDAHSNNFQNFTPSTNGYDSWLGRFDLHVSEKSNIAFRYGQTPWSNFANIYWGNAAEPSTEAPSTRVARNWGADWSYVISPSMVFSLRGGLARYEGFSGNTYGQNFDPRKLGFSDSLVNQFTALQFPSFILGNYSPMGATKVTSYETHDNWSIAPTMNWMRGRHMIKFGGDVRRYNRNQLQPGLASGQYTFSKAWTQADPDPNKGDSVSGNEIASLLLGYPAKGTVDNQIDPAYRNHYVALFVQDDFKLTRNFTLTLGLRWDYETPVTERYNRMVRTFDVNAASPIASQVSGLSLKGGLVYAGADGNSDYAFNPKRKNFQPRIGFAWNVRPKWVLRGGYGLTMLGQSTVGPSTGYSQNTAMVTTVDNNYTPAATLSDPYPGIYFPKGLLTPVGNSQGLGTNLGQSISAQYVDRPLPYSQQYSFGFQHELPWNFMTDVSYAGNITKRLPVSLNLNYIPTAALTQLPVSQRQAYFSAPVSNPMAGLLPNSSFNGATVPRQQLLYAFPQYSQVTMTDVPIGSQNYNALQTRLTRRFTNGFMFQTTYTFSKTLEQVSTLNAQDVNVSDLTKTSLEKRLSEYDIPHKITFQGSLELPFGRGKRFANAVNPFVNGFIGGWNLSGQYALQSGFILPFPNAAPLTNRSAKLSDDQRNALAKAAGRDHWDPSYDVWFDTTLFPKTALSSYDLRTFPTRFPDVRAQGVKSAELSIYKEFVFKEKVRWQVRADAYNAFNHPWFGQQQSVDVGNASQFGHLKADMNNETRIIALAMKILF